MIGGKISGRRMRKIRTKRRKRTKAIRKTKIFTNQSASATTTFPKEPIYRWNVSNPRYKNWKTTWNIGKITAWALVEKYQRCQGIEQNTQLRQRRNNLTPPLNLTRLSSVIIGRSDTRIFFQGHLLTLNLIFWWRISESYCWPLFEVITAVIDSYSKERLLPW